MWAKIITIKRTKALNYFSLCALNLFNTRVSQFELNYWNKWTFPRHSNLLRCTCTHTLTGNFIRYTLLVPGWTPLCLQNCLNSSWHRSNKVLETFFRDFGLYWHDSITQLLQIFLAAHPWCESPVPPHPKAALLDWDLVTVEAIWVKWTHCHVQETSLRWFELCDIVHYPAGSSHQKMDTL